MRTIIAGNWKMHKDQSETIALLSELVQGLKGLPEGMDVVIAPPFPFLSIAVERVRGSRLRVAAQNCHQGEQGAFTGEVSAAMLKSIGVSHCIVGHSERRQYFGETDAVVGEKIAALLAHGLTPIFCCGEKKEEREAGRHFDVVTEQMKGALGRLDNDRLERVVIAYEPVWAIGTGLTATAAQAQEMHAHIRMLLHTHGAKVSSTVPVLYGGSCNPKNAEDLFAGEDVNGGLIGGASLVADQFIDLVRIAQRVKSASIT